MTSRFRSMFENLSERERRLVVVMGLGFLAFIIFLAVFFVQTMMNGLEEEAQEVSEILTLIDEKESAYLEAKEEAKANEVFGQRKPKPLRTLVDKIGKQLDVTVPDMKELPDQAHPGNWMEHAIELSMREVGLAKLARFMEEIEGNRNAFPIAITKLDIRKRRRAEDSYDVKIIISTYERLDEPAPGAKRTGAAARKGGH